jgi:[DsrC]-trisulfide reductase subunit P
MFEYALRGNRQYWVWLAILGGFIGVGFLCYLLQFNQGLGITGMSRDVTWGFYIAQFTFLVGVAASAVMVVLPCYLHNYKAFGKIAILGEFIAIASVTMCILFIMVDLGQPMRGVNIILHPSPTSLMFWDMIVLNGYLFLNLIISWVTLESERCAVAPPKWIKPVIYLSIPWAVSIHTVTAFLYSGLSARSFWMTAVLAPRFLASAFAAGPALLIIICLILRKLTKFDPGKEPIQTLAKIVAYAMAANFFFVLMEVFTAFYSAMPEHTVHFKYLFGGIEGASALTLWMWFSVMIGSISLILLIYPRTRIDETILSISCVGVFISLWIDKGLAMVVAGFIPSPLGSFTEYAPTLPELLISLGIYAIGMFIVTALYKITLTVRKEI